jgi:Xaa-Pro aminopeptidase
MSSIGNVGALSPDYVYRWERARANAAGESLDALYINAGPTFTWLAGYSPYPGGWPDFLSSVIFPVIGEPVMVISAMHAEILDRDLCPIKRVFTYVDGDDPRPVLRSAFAEAGITSGKVGVENHGWLSDAELVGEVVPKVKLQISPLFDGLRAVKDAFEMALLRQSARCQDAAFAAAHEAMRVDASLNDVEQAIRGAMMAEGCESIKLLGVFKSRRPRSLLHGELVDIDFGTAVCGGYTIDSSRNVVIGEPAAELLKQWDLVERAFRETMATVRPGVTAGEVHAACERVITDGGYTQTWKVGHGVGLSDGHEAPWLQRGSQTMLEPGMTFTIDPGFFVGRDLPLHIEDTVLVTQHGWENLNHHPHDLIVV